MKSNKTLMFNLSKIPETKENLEAELLDMIGSTNFSHSIREITAQFRRSLLSGYCVKNSKGLLNQFSWNQAEQEFTKTRLNTAIKNECVFLEENTQTRLQDSESFNLEEFKAALLKAIQLHQLKIEFEDTTFDDSQLTPREKEILKHILQFKNNKSIASEFNIRPAHS